jgi:hypothetical protein
MSSRHPLYRRWLNMVGRCSNPDHPDWRKYGARGIAVCERWKDFENFVSDMEPSFKPGLQIDRIDNDQGYFPGNCHWTTATKNIRNRRSTVFMETPWGRMTQAEAAERIGWSWEMMDSRRRHGWSYERIFGST